MKTFPPFRDKPRDSDYFDAIDEDLSRTEFMRAEKHTFIESTSSLKEAIKQQLACEWEGEILEGKRLFQVLRKVYGQICVVEYEFELKTKLKKIGVTQDFKTAVCHLCNKTALEWYNWSPYAPCNLCKDHSPHVICIACENSQECRILRSNMI